MIQFSPSVVLFFGVGLMFVLLTLVKFNRPDDEERRSKPSPHSRGNGKDENPYKAVSIVTLPGCCHAAKTIQNKMFLTNEAPSLPLNKCTQPDCLCSYRHFSDRRQNPDRRNLFALWKERGIQQGAAHERRKTRERRSVV